MAASQNRMLDAMVAALDMARSHATEPAGMIGYGVVQRFNADGEEDLIMPFHNVITDTGDLYYANRAVFGINSNGISAPTTLTGMQIGSTSTAVNKAATTGVALGAILAGQNFDATFPSVSNLGVNLGVNAVYKTTYAAGTGTGTVTEATITNGTIGTASTAGNTISRVVFTGIVKGAADSLAITWNHKFLGT